MHPNQQDTTVSVRGCADYEYSRVKAAVIKLGDDLAGGWKAIIPTGARVLLKPNLLTPASADQVVSPHPAVVRAVAEACLEAGAGSLRIGDSPGFGTARKVCEKCGILDAARTLDIPVVEFTESVTVPAPEGFYHRSFTIAREVAEADIVINLPKFKTHAMMLLTLAVKNLYGVFVGKQKARWHFQSGRNYQHFARLLVELAYTVRPALSVLDAVVAMEGNGPGSGTPRPLGFVAASRDLVSLDRIAVELAGLRPEQLYTLAVAREMGFTTDLSRIPLKGDPLEQLRTHGLQLAAPMQVEGPRLMGLLYRPLQRFMTTRPAVDADRCCGCGVCRQSCPAGCISRRDGKPPVLIDYRACIRCFCCQELCPEGAIRARDAIGVKLLKKLKME